MMQAEYSYDPWGRQRDPVTLAPCAPGKEPELMFGRGYTGHEHLPEYGLIHMNARLYDPQTGRFLSPDPYVQNPANTQSYNRYAYALNNPMRYIDPSGEMYTYDYENGYYVDMWGDYASWKEVYDWLVWNDQLIDVDLGGSSGGISIGANGGSLGIGGSGLSSATSGGSSSRAIFSFTTKDGHWNIPSGFYEYGISYYNISTNQLRYLKPHDYEAGTTLLTELLGGLSDLYAWLDRTGSKLSIGGLAYEGLEKLSANKKYWLGKNGKFYSRSWGGNQYTGSRAGALKAANLYKAAGKVVGVAGLWITYWQVRTGAISGIEAVFDTTFSIVGMTGWGTPLSLAYFGGKFLYETISGQDLFDKPY